MPPAAPKKRRKWPLGCLGAALAFLLLAVVIGLLNPKKATPAAVAATPPASAGPTAVSTSRPSAVAKPAVSATTVPAAAPAPTCTLPDNRDILVRSVDPGLAPSAEELGEVDLADCSPTLDYIAETSPTGPGYCTTAAYASDNPGYNVNATAAAPLKDVQESIGAGC